MKPENSTAGVKTVLNIELFDDIASGPVKLRPDL